MTGKSVEDLARELILQIRNSNFLEENPPKGESIFLLKNDFVSSADTCDEADKSQPHRKDTVEDIAKTIMIQLRTSGLPTSNESISVPLSFPVQMGSSEIDFQDLDELLSGKSNPELEFSPVSGSMFEKVSASSSLCQQSYHPCISPAIIDGPDVNSRPGFHDAVHFLLGELGRTASHQSVKATIPASCERNLEEDELVEAFRAMAPTVDAFLLDFSGRLEETSLEGKSDLPN